MRCIENGGDGGSSSGGDAMKSAWNQLKSDIHTLAMSADEKKNAGKEKEKEQGEKKKIELPTFSANEIKDFSVRVHVSIIQHTIKQASS